MKPMKRRKFITKTGQWAAGIGAGAYALPKSWGEVPEAQPANKMKIYKSLKFGMVKTEGTLLEKFRMLKELGYDGVELDSPNDLDNNEVLEARDKTGLQIPGVVNSLHWKYPLSDPDPEVRRTCRESIVEALHDCKLYGGTTVLVVPGVVNAEVGYADAWKRSTEEIMKLKSAVDETGIKIAFENVWNNFILSPLEAAYYVDQFDHPLIGWYFDIGNILRYGWPEHWIEVLDHRIMKVDVKEFSRKKQEEEGLWKGFDVELMEGSIDWPAVNKALEKIGYHNGWASAEVRGGGEERLRTIIQKMNEIFD